MLSVIAILFQVKTVVGIGMRHNRLSALNVWNGETSASWRCFDAAKKKRPKSDRTVKCTGEQWSAANTKPTVMICGNCKQQTRHTPRKKPAHEPKWRPQGVRGETRAE